MNRNFHPGNMFQDALYLHVQVRLAFSTLRRTLSLFVLGDLIDA